MQSEGFQYEKNFEILSFQIDPNGKLRWSSLFDLMQEVAWKHADSREFGKKLFDQGLMWVLSRFEVQVHRMPSWGEKIKVMTASRGTDKLFALREFKVETEKGENLAEGLSAWLLLDTISKRPKRPKQVLPSELFEDLESPILIPEKLTSQSGGNSAPPFSVKPFDLDMNNHVNNVSYIRWVEDFCVENKIILKQLLINYLGEAKLADEIILKTKRINENLDIQGEIEGKPVFLAKINGSFEESVA